jgi:hypothetical protein
VYSKEEVANGTVERAQHLAMVALVFPPPGFSVDSGTALRSRSTREAMAMWRGSDSILSGSPQTADIFFSRSTGSGKIFPNPVNASNSPGESDVVSAILLNHHGDAYLLWQANAPNLPSQVFFDRVLASFSRQSDFRVKVSPDFANAVQGEILQLSVVGHDLDDVKDASLICSPVPSRFFCSRLRPGPHCLGNLHFQPVIPIRRARAFQGKLDGVGST